MLWHQFWTCPSGGPAEWSQSRSLGVMLNYPVAFRGTVSIYDVKDGFW